MFGAGSLSEIENDPKFCGVKYVGAEEELLRLFLVSSHLSTAIAPVLVFSSAKVNCADASATGLLISISQDTVIPPPLSASPAATNGASGTFKR